MSETKGATRALAGCALAGVSVIAAVVSYLHGLAVVEAVGATAPVSYLIPFLADLVILGATTALLDAARQRQRLSALTACSLLAGVAVTLAMNVAAGLGHGMAGALVAGWPAVAFILALESLAGMVRRGRSGSPSSPAAAAPDHRAVTSLDEAIRGAPDGMSQRQLAAAFEVSRARVSKALGQAAPMDPAAAAVIPDPSAAAGQYLNGSRP